MPAYENSQQKEDQKIGTKNKTNTWYMRNETEHKRREGDQKGCYCCKRKTYVAPVTIVRTQERHTWYSVATRRRGTYRHENSGEGKENKERDKARIRKRKDRGKKIVPGTPGGDGSKYSSLLVRSVRA